jgi:hypothetical protein
MKMDRIKEAPSFCEQKEAKKLFQPGAWGGSLVLPHHKTRIKESFLSVSEDEAHELPNPPDQIQKSFWVLFSKSTACLPACLAWGLPALLSPAMPRATLEEFLPEF